MLNNEKIAKFPLESGKVYRCTHQGVKKIFSYPQQNGYEAEILNGPFIFLSASDVAEEERYPFNPRKINVYKLKVLYNGKIMFLVQETEKYIREFIFPVDETSKKV